MYTSDFLDHPHIWATWTPAGPTTNFTIVNNFHNKCSSPWHATCMKSLTQQTEKGPSTQINIASFRMIHILAGWICPNNVGCGDPAEGLCACCRITHTTTGCCAEAPGTAQFYMQLSPVHRQSVCLDGFSGVRLPTPLWSEIKLVP